jgi:hypothetical protein
MNNKAAKMDDDATAVIEGADGIYGSADYDAEELVGAADQEAPDAKPRAAASRDESSMARTETSYARKNEDEYNNVAFKPQEMPHYSPEPQKVVATAAKAEGEWQQIVLSRMFRCT